MRDETADYLGKVVNGLVKVAAAVRADTDEVVGTGDHIAIIKHYNQIRIAAEQIKEAREAINDINDSLSKTIIPDVVANLKERTGEKPPFNIEGVGRVTVSYRFSCTMPDKEVGINWLKDNGHGGLVQETVNSSTLSAFAKDMLENEGVELPPDVFKVGTSPYTSITKAR